MSAEVVPWHEWRIAPMRRDVRVRVGAALCSDGTWAAGTGDEPDWTTADEHDVADGDAVEWVAWRCVDRPWGIELDRRHRWIGGEEAAPWAP